MPSRSSSRSPRRQLKKFKTRSGKTVTFYARPEGSRTGSRPLGEFAKFVRKFAKKSDLIGPKMMKAAAKEYRKSH